MSLAGTGIGAYFGGPGGAAIGNGIANAGKEFIASFFDEDSKFAKGLTNKKTTEAVDKVGKAYEIYKDDKLDKTAKINEFNKLIGTNIATTSNGHVPVGYSAASSQGATVSSGSMGLRKAFSKFEEKTKKKKDAIKKAKANKAKKAWDEWKKKNTNKKKK